MKINKLISSILATFMGLYLLAPGVMAAAFGISPPWIVNENLKRGSSFVYVIDLNTNDPAQDMMVSTVITGDAEVLDWLTIRGQKNLMMPKGEEHVPMYVEVNIPPDARLGKYEGDISITVSPKSYNSPTGGVGILLGGHVSVQLQVIDYNVTDFWVKRASFQPVIAGETVTVGLVVKNLGNTVLSDVQLNIRVSDYKTGEFITEVSASKLDDLIYPQTVKETAVALPLKDLPVGQYWMEIQAFKGAESVYQNKLFLGIEKSPLNNDLETAVTVGEQGARAVAPAGGVALDQTTVNLTTTVTVRAPLTNQLIGLMIVLMIVLIVITGKIYGNVRHKKRR